MTTEMMSTRRLPQSATQRTKRTNPMEKTTALAEKLRAIADLTIQEAEELLQKAGDLRAAADLLVEEASKPALEPMLVPEPEPERTAPPASESGQYYISGHRHRGRHLSTLHPRSARPKRTLALRQHRVRWPALQRQCLFAQPVLPPDRRQRPRRLARPVHPAADRRMGGRRSAAPGRQGQTQSLRRHRQGQRNRARPAPAAMTEDVE
jgi:hypothetical protein